MDGCERWGEELRVIESGFELFIEFGRDFNCFESIMFCKMYLNIWVSCLGEIFFLLEMWIWELLVLEEFRVMRVDKIIKGESS